MPKTNRRKRHRILALIRSRGDGARRRVDRRDRDCRAAPARDPAHRVPPTAVPPTAVPPTPGKKPRPEFQDASCPDVQLISIPGTWESSPQLDPFNPTQFPIALLLNVTNPIRAAVRHGPARGLHRSLHRAVPQSAVGRQADVLQRQPRRGHPRRGEGDDGHEQPLPADQLRAGRLLAGRGDRGRHRQRHRQRPRTRRRRIWCSV